jgi:hypothetical protein
VLAEVSEEVTHLFFAGIDDVAGGRLVDGVGDVAAKFLEAAAQALQ